MTLKKLYIKKYKLIIFPRDLGDRAINNAEYSCFVTILNINKHLKCDLVFPIIRARHKCSEQ